jgi:AraC family transcriptional regulator
VLLCRSFPTVEDIPANREFRRYFYSKWGRENCIVSARSRHAEYPPFQQSLSIKAAWGGPERYHLHSRTVAVDDDNYLVLNDQRTYASTLRSPEPVHSFSIFFRPGLAEETLGALHLPAERALEAGGEVPAKSVEFAEQLHPHDRLVSPLLRHISDQVDAGLEDELWYEEHFSFLLERMFRARREEAAVIDSLGMVRASTRREIRRRIGLSTDFIHTCYMRPLGMTDLARSASLSRYHFIGLFHVIHGVTPCVYLQRKRARVAARLLRSTDLSQEQVAKRVGFESRSTMFRQLRRHAGAGMRGLRGAAPPSQSARRVS